MILKNFCQHQIGPNNLGPNSESFELFTSISVKRLPQKKTNYNVHNITSNNPAKQTIHKRGKQGHLKWKRELTTYFLDIYHMWQWWTNCMTTGQNSTLEPEALLVHTTQFIFRSTVALGPKNLTLIRMTDAFLKIL